MSRKEFQSINPATGEVFATAPATTDAELEESLRTAREAFKDWRAADFNTRARLMKAAAQLLRERQVLYARMISSEMGKPISEALAEIEKCAWGCDFYAENAEHQLAPEARSTNAAESYVAFRPLGVVLAIMPWNFPFWQVFRFAATALMAGDTALLKHASNVSQCSLAISELFADAGFPQGVFKSLLIPGKTVERVIRDERVAAITLTGSSETGAEVAAIAGSVVKKQVLELGGADAFVVLEDADIQAAARTGARARFQNAGQSCICAKRFIVVNSIAEEFVARLAAHASDLRVGDPADPETQMGPLAREDLVASLSAQVDGSVNMGARLVTGGTRIPGPGNYYEATVLDAVTERMPAFTEETFGPVASVTRVRDEGEALRVANATQYGLGGAVWTRDTERGQQFAAAMESGAVFVNGMTISDPRLPFGGVKRSGYGRELAEYGIREFVNIQTVWVGPEATTEPQSSRLAAE